MSSISVAVTFSIIKGTSRGVFVKAGIVSFFKDEMGISLAKAHNSLGRNREPNLQILLHVNERIVKLLKHMASPYLVGGCEDPEGKRKAVGFIKVVVEVIGVLDDCESANHRSYQQSGQHVQWI